MGPSLRVLQTIRQTGKDGPVWDRPLRKERNRFDICRRGGAEGELPRRGKRSHPGVCPSRHSPKSAVGATLAVARNAGRRGRRPLRQNRKLLLNVVGAAFGRPRLPRRSGETLCGKRTQSETRPLIRPLRGHLTLSPLAFGHLPLTRGVGPQGEGFAGEAPGAPFPDGKAYKKRDRRPWETLLPGAPHCAYR